MNINKPYSINWDTRSGELLDDLLKLIPQTENPSLLVLGTAALEMTITADIKSPYAEVAVEKAHFVKGGFDTKQLYEIVEANNFGKGKREPFIQVCNRQIIDCGRGYPLRYSVELRNDIRVAIMHPVDVLVSKIGRMDERDIKDFETIQNCDGKLDEKMFIMELRQVVDCYLRQPTQQRMSQFKDSALTDSQEDALGDWSKNTQTLWKNIFHKNIDIEKKIILPGLELKCVL